MKREHPTPISLYDGGRPQPWGDHGPGTDTRLARVMDWCESRRDKANIAGMARYGITTAAAYGIPMPALRGLAKEIGRDHPLALRLWETGRHEARILAGLIDDPALVTPAQMDRWARDFDSWDICDQVCSNLFDRTAFAWQKIWEWARCDEEYVRRAAFVLIAALAVHDRKAGDDVFTGYLPLVRMYATDDRNFVRKAVNWALRQVGKRNPTLHAAAITVGEDLLTLDSRSARWIARDALRELRDEKTVARVMARKPLR